MSADMLRISGMIFLVQMLINAGVFMMAGQLLPQMLGGFYAKVGVGARGLLGMAVFFMPANYLLSYCYRVFDPAAVTSINIFMATVIMIGMTALVIGSRLSWMMLPAAAVTIAGCLWLYSLLGQKV